MFSRTQVLGGVVMLVLIAGTFLSARRPDSIIASIYTPDTTHVHQIYKNSPISQQLDTPPSHIDGIAFWVDRSATFPPENTPILLHVRDAAANKEIRTIQSTIGKHLSRRQLLHYTPTQVVDTEDWLLQFSFERIPGNHPLLFELEVPQAPKAQALRIRYQSDPSLADIGETFSGTTNKQGALGIVLYERPTIAMRGARWLLHPEHRLAWVGIAAIIAGITGTLRLRSHTSALTKSPFWQNGWQYFQAHRPHIYWSAFGVAVLAIVMYVPATTLMFYHDDLGILARIQHFSQTDPGRLLTAHAYHHPFDPFASFELNFYRPVSSTIVPLILFSVFGPNPSIFYGANILFIAATAALFVVLGTLLLRSWQGALFASVFWVSHPALLGIAYWWSPLQDILALLFVLGALLCYIRLRIAPTRALWIGFTALLLTGLFSKDQVVIFPAVLLALELLFSRRTDSSWSHYLRDTLIRISPAVLCVGIFLLTRTIALGDPTLPPELFVGDTYALKLSPIEFVRNLVVYAGWSVDSPNWTEIHGIGSQLPYVMERFKTEGPLYPGFIAIAAWSIALLTLWRIARIRPLLLLGTFWWGLWIGPQLLMINDWKYRWLYMSIWGIGFCIAAACTAIQSQSIRQTLLWVAIIGCAITGMRTARDADRTQFYQEQSAYIQDAVGQLHTQQSLFTPTSPVYFVGIREDLETSLTGYVVDLFAPHQGLPITRTDTIPENPEQSAIIIDMRDKEAYYPGWAS